MKQILNENKEILFEGNDNEMTLAFNYLTKPFHTLVDAYVSSDVLEEGRKLQGYKNLARELVS